MKTITILNNNKRQHILNVSNLSKTISLLLYWIIKQPIIKYLFNFTVDKIIHNPFKEGFVLCKTYHASYTRAAEFIRYLKFLNMTKNSHDFDWVRFVLSKNITTYDQIPLLLWTRPNIAWSGYEVKDCYDFSSDYLQSCVKDHLLIINGSIWA